ncbi:MAG: hypothetical protein ABIR48_02085 [Gammaproteobacteria bacterium]
MMLGIAAAMGAEMRIITGRRVNIGSVARYSNQLLALSGIGPQRARAAAKLLLDQGATALLSWGTAAALDSRLEPGSLILPKTIIAADGTLLSVCPEWHERLYRQLSPGFQIYTGTMLESPAVLCNANEKRALFERSGAIAVDMESAALAAVAHAARVPFMIIRAVADTADMSVPQRLVHIIQVNGTLRALHLFAAVALHPPQWLAIARLAIGFRAAQKKLAAVVKYTGGTFSAFT